MRRMYQVIHRIFTGCSQVAHRLPTAREQVYVSRPGWWPACRPVCCGVGVTTLAAPDAALRVWARACKAQVAGLATGRAPAAPADRGRGHGLASHRALLYFA